MTNKTKRSALTLQPGGTGAELQAGHLTRRLAAGAALAATAISTGFHMAAGWEAREAMALFACLLLLGAMAFHIADHVADFLGRSG